MAKPSQPPPAENTMQLAEILSDLVSLRVCVRLPPILFTSDYSSTYSPACSVLPHPHRLLTNPRTPPRHSLSSPRAHSNPLPQSRLSKTKTTKTRISNAQRTLSSCIIRCARRIRGASSPGGWRRRGRGFGELLGCDGIGRGTFCVENG
jgi:hypothetical protein